LRSGAEAAAVAVAEAAAEAAVAAAAAAAVAEAAAAACPGDVAKSANPNFALPSVIQSVSGHYALASFHMPQNSSASADRD
jgi:hypothetical protein